MLQGQFDSAGATCGEVWLAYMGNLSLFWEEKFISGGEDGKLNLSLIKVAIKFVNQQTGKLDIESTSLIHASSCEETGKARLQLLRIDTENLGRATSRERLRLRKLGLKDRVGLRRIEVLVGLLAAPYCPTLNFIRTPCGFRTPILMEVD